MSYCGYNCICNGTIIYLGWLLPATSSNLPKAGGPRSALLFGLASDGVYICPLCYQKGGSLLHCPSNLTIIHQRMQMAVYFCCTILGVTSTGRYPASCPVKPGLSSPRKQIFRAAIVCSTYFFYILKLLYTILIFSARKFSSSYT